MLTVLALTQLSLVAMQQVRKPAPPSPFRPHPEGISQLINRIASSKYGLLDPLPDGKTDLQGIPLEKIWKDLPAEEPTRPQPSSGALQAPTWLWPIIEEESQIRSLDPYLVESVIHQESGFEPQAISPAGAQGLMQLMPETAVQVGVSDPFDPQQNVAGGSEYLAWQMRDFGGDLQLALAAYNAGPAAVRRWGGVPPYSETTTYVRSVMEDYRGKLQTQPGSR